MSRLFEQGFSAVGPASTARLALALAAQTGPTIAIVAQPPTGRRGAGELAEALLRDWNIRSVVLCSDQEQDQAWSARPEQAQRLRNTVLGLGPLRRDVA